MLGRIRHSFLPRNVFVLVDLDTGADDLGFSKWVEEIQGKQGSCASSICDSLDVIGVCFNYKSILPGFVD